MMNDFGLTHSLSDEQWASLLRDGIVKVPGAYQGNLLSRIRDAVDEFYNSHPNGNREDTGAMANERRSDGLIMFFHMPLRDEVFQIMLEHPIVTTTLTRMLGPDFYLSDFSMRKVCPGSPRMPYHKDNHGGLSLLILTDDIGEDEGATTYVPGTHVMSPAPMYCMKHTLARHPKEIQATGKVGDLYFFFLDGWHARSANMSNRLTGIMLPDFRNRRSDTQEFLRGHAKNSSAELRPTIRNMLRPVQAAGTSDLRGIERIAFRGNYCEQFFREFLFYLVAYAMPKPAHWRADNLPPQTTAAILELRVSVARYFRRLHPTALLRATILHLVRKMPAGQRALSAFKRVLNRSPVN